MAKDAAVYGALIPALFTTLTDFAGSVRTSIANSSAVPRAGSTPIALKRSSNVGEAVV